MRGFATGAVATVLLFASRTAAADASVAWDAGAAPDGLVTANDGPALDAVPPTPAPPVPPPITPPAAPEAYPSPDAPEGATGAEATRLETVVNGYLDTRFTGQRIRTDRLLPADDVPALGNLTEGNFQLKLRGGAKSLVLADASFFFQRAGFYRGPEHDVAAYRPLAVISELYGSHSFSDHVNVTLGKKRVVWGPGFLINPMDLLNPPKDPTDPSLQRAGAWLARVEFPTERVTVSLVGAAKVLEEYAGVPARLAVYPAYDPRDDGQAHVAGAARLYALIADTDVNVQYVFTNLYNDAFRTKSRLGLSFSRLVGKALEIHMEALGQLGSSRLYVNTNCIADIAAAGACAAAGTPIADRTKLDADTPVVKGIIGARYTFGDDSMLGADYALFTDGYSDSEWRAFLQGLALARDARAAGLPVPAGLGPGTATGSDPAGGTPQKFSFEPQRRQYLFINYVKPRISDDFTLNLTLIASLQDLSGQLSPQVVWQVREWINLTAQLFVPIPAAFPTDIGGTHLAEYGLAPVDYRGLASARVFY